MKAAPKVFAFLSLAVVVTTLQTFAQAPAGQAPPARTRVQTVQVKPDMLRAWLDFQRTETVPALKKAGVSWRWGSRTAARSVRALATHSSRLSRTMPSSTPDPPSGGQ